MNYVIVHYSGEIGTKGANRRVFEKKLKDNIRSFLTKDNYEYIKIVNSRIVVKLKKNYDKKKIIDILEKVTGISYFAFAKFCKKNLDNIRKKVFSSFKYDKGYNIKINIPKTTPDLSYKSIRRVLKPKLNIHSDKSLYVEILNLGCFVYEEKFKAKRGLPVGVTGKLISLISGGIDSPVAAYKMFLRGCSVSFVHFYNPTQVRKSVRQKLVDLVEVLSDYQFKTKLYFVKFDEIQRNILALIPSDIRMIVYRRIMFFIAEKILKKENAQGFVTGDSLSQVASQTMENIDVIYRATDYPIFSPLIGDSKQEIIKLAKEIGTYKISIRPYEDCCSFFIAKHPETKGELRKIKNYEQQLNLNKLIYNAVKNSEVKVFVK